MNNQHLFSPCNLNINLSRVNKTILDMVYTVFYRKLNNWVIPENIHTIPQAVSWNSKEEGGWLLDWNAEGMGAWGGEG